MKKDIEMPEVVGISLAVVRSVEESEYPQWNVYLINNNDFPIFSVLVSSRGYGEINGERRETSVLRHMFDAVNAESHVMIESIDPAVFPLYNEYWVSYYLGNQIYDKRFTFVPESITESNMIRIPLLQMLGVLHM